MEGGRLIKCSNSAMESDWTRESDFGFAFNDSKFSDRVLRIEIMADPVDAAPPDSDTATTTTTTITDCKKNENQDVEMVDGEEFAANNNDSATIVRIKTLHINSAILAAKSPFFYKLFTNGMRESEQRQVTLRIHAYEEDAVMELLNFMYTNTLNNITPPAAVLDVLIAADKFEVSSYMRYCRNSMTSHSALFYLEQLPRIDAVQPLIDAAKQYLVDRYKDITKFQEEVMALPLSGIEAILASDDLQIDSEDTLYDFVLKWATQHCYIQEERPEILGRLVCLIRFPYMTVRKLHSVLTDNDFKHKGTCKQLVAEALIFKAKDPYLQRQQSKESASLNHRRFVERAYKYRPVKLVKFERPLQQCVVYMDLKREECATLFPFGRVYSQAFHLCGQGFFLSAECNMDQQGSSHCFGLFLGMQKNSTLSMSVDYEFASRSKPTMVDFVSKYKDNFTFTAGKVVGHNNLFAIPWSSFIAEDSLFFINGVLHLRAELTIKHYQPFIPDFF